MNSLPPVVTQAQPPTPTSVYKYYDTHNILLYVGITSRGSQRNREHNAGKEWWPFVHRQEVEHLPSRDAALARETSLIRRHRPPFNKQQNPDHATMRTTYLLFRALPSEKQGGFGGVPATKEGRRLSTQMEHRLPLSKDSETEREVTYTHNSKFFGFASCVNTGGEVILEHPRKIAVLAHTKREGNRIFFTFRKTGSSKTPQAIVLKTRVTQRPYTVWGFKAVAA